MKTQYFTLEIADEYNEESYTTGLRTKRQAWAELLELRKDAKGRGGAALRVWINNGKGENVYYEDAANPV